MRKYHKIQTAWLRNPEDRFKTLLKGQWAKPEFEMLKTIPWVGTEKIDGTNIRVMWFTDPNRFDEEMHLDMNLEFRGKTDRAMIPPKLLGRLPEIFWPDNMREVFGKTPVCLYGEGYGNKIQKAGKFYLPSRNDFILFDVRIGEYWLQRIDVERLAERFGIQAAPIVFDGTLEEAIELVRKGFFSTVSEKKQIAEGLILRPKIDLYNRKGERIITKIKHKDF